MKYVSDDLSTDCLFIIGLMSVVLVIIVSISIQSPPPPPTKPTPEYVELPALSEAQFQELQRLIREDIKNRPVMENVK